MSCMPCARCACRPYSPSPPMLTLALGIGATTAIFSLIHAVMLRSLPVADPASLYRIGDGRQLLRPGRTAGRWGMFPLPLCQRAHGGDARVRALTAFQAGGSRSACAAATSDAAAAAARRIRHRQLLLPRSASGAFGGPRLHTGRRSARRAARRDAQPSHLAAGSTAATRRSSGSTFVIEGHPFTVVGITPPGFFGETLRSDPPELWMPLQQEPLMSATELAAAQAVPMRGCASSAACGRAPRPTASRRGSPTILRQWMRERRWAESGELADRRSNAMLPKQTSSVDARRRRRRREMKDHTRPACAFCSPSARLVLLIACANVANLLLARGSAAALADRCAPRARRLATRLIRQSLTESVVLACWRRRRRPGWLPTCGVDGCMLALAFRSAHFVPITHAAVAPCAGVRLRRLAAHRHCSSARRRRGSTTRTNPAEALRGADRTTRDRSSLCRQKSLVVVQATLSLVLLAGADAADPQPRPTSSIRTSDSKPTHRVSLGVNRAVLRPTPPELTAMHLPRAARAADRAFPACRARPWRSTIHSPTTGARSIVAPGTSAADVTDDTTARRGIA